MSAGYLPWFFFQQRTVFNFYAIVFEPFVILAIVYCTKLILTGARAKSERAYRVAELGLIGFVALIALNFIYFMPLYLGDVMTYEAWHARMWFASWI